MGKNLKSIKVYLAKENCSIIKKRQKGKPKKPRKIKLSQNIKNKIKTKTICKTKAGQIIGVRRKGQFQGRDRFSTVYISFK